MKYPLNAEIIIEPDTKQPVFSWEVVRSEQELSTEGGNRRWHLVEELRVTAPKETKIAIFDGRNISIDNGSTWWRVDGNPHEVQGGWSWSPGMVTFHATRITAT